MSPDLHHFILSFAPQWVITIALATAFITTLSKLLDAATGLLTSAVRFLLAFKGLISVVWVELLPLIHRLRRLVRHLNNRTGKPPNDR